MLDIEDGEEIVLRAWRPRDELSPTPPRGWLIANYFCGPDHPFEAAVWLYVLGTAQIASKEVKRKLYQVARDRHGYRVLVVDPEIESHITDAQLDVQCSMEGGGEVEPVLQEAAATVIAQRKWKAMPLAERIDALLGADEDADLGLVSLDMAQIASTDGGLDLAYQLSYEH